jgi:hypothetical protein
MCFVSCVERCVQPNEPTPLRESPPPPFIGTRRDGVHAQGIVEVVVFSPNRGGAVVEHCGKYTVGYGARRGSRPGHRPWSCGDRAGVLAAPASWRLQRAAWSLLWGVPSSRRGVTAFRGSYRPGSCPGQGRSRFRGSCPCRLGAPRKGKYEEGMRSWQYSSWSSAEHVLHCVAGSHSVVTASGMVEQ